MFAEKAPRRRALRHPDRSLGGPQPRRKMMAVGEVLDRMREELDDWQKETRDLGLARRTGHEVHPLSGWRETGLRAKRRCLVFAADSYGQEPGAGCVQPAAATTGCSCSVRPRGCSTCFTRWTRVRQPILARIHRYPYDCPSGSHRLRTRVSQIGHRRQSRKDV